MTLGVQMCFTLSTPDDANLNPSLPIGTVDSVVISMFACEGSPAFPDEIGCFQGFGASSQDSLNSTVQTEDTWCEAINDSNST